MEAKDDLSMLFPCKYICIVDFEAVLEDSLYEITEFPVIVLDLLQEGRTISTFHKYVMPSIISKPVIERYISSKYGRMNLDKVGYSGDINWKLSYFNMLL